MGFRTELDHLSRHRNAYTLALSAAMGSIFFGWDIGLIGGILSLPSFKQYFGIDRMPASARANLNGNIVAILQVGCFFGALSTGFISSRFGRKRPLVLAGFIYLIGSTIQTVAGVGSGSQAMALRVLYFSRFTGGFGLGMTTALIPSYVSESTPQVIRGRCTCLIQSFNNLGMMLSFWVNYGSFIHVPFGQMQWRIPFAVQAIPGVLFVFFMLPQPESPRWFVEQQRYDEAAKSLAYMARSSVDDPTVLAILEEIKGDLAGKQVSAWEQFRMMGESRITALRSFIPSFVMLCQQWNGANSINYFSPEVFASLGITGTDSELLATGIYGIVKYISVTLTVLFGVEGLGRKKCLLIGGVGQGLMMFWIGGYIALHTEPTIGPASYVSIVAIYCYAIFFSIGWGPTPWVIAGEVAPNHVRSAAMSVAIGVNWLFSFTISRVTSNLLEGIGYGTFLLFGVLCMLMSVWVYFFLPETKGYALEDVRFLFEKDMVVRALEDAPGGQIFLGGRRSTPVAELRRVVSTDLDVAITSLESSSEEKMVVRS